MDEGQLRPWPTRQGFGLIDPGQGKGVALDLENASAPPAFVRAIAGQHEVAHLELSPAIARGLDR